jgi:hypothetical protein
MGSFERRRMRRIKVLAFDTGGTILDWYGGLTDWGTAQGDERDWHELANEYRRQSLRARSTRSSRHSISMMYIAMFSTDCSTRMGSAVPRPNVGRSPHSATSSTYGRILRQR